MSEPEELQRIANLIADELYAQLEQHERAGAKFVDVVGELVSIIEKHASSEWPYKVLLDASTLEMKRRESLNKN